jgi:hypothetical protein
MGLFHKKKNKKKEETKNKADPHQLPDFSDHKDLPEFPSNDKFQAKEDDFKVDSFPSVEEPTEMASPHSDPLPIQDSIANTPMEDMGGSAEVDPTGTMLPEIDEMTDPSPAFDNNDFTSGPDLSTEADLGTSSDITTTDNRNFFVKINKYEKALDTVKEIKKLNDEAKSVLTKLKDIKQKEDAELREWERSLEHIKEKVLAIDKTLFQGREQL